MVMSVWRCDRIPKNTISEHGVYQPPIKYYSVLEQQWTSAHGVKENNPLKWIKFERYKNYVTTFIKKEVQVKIIPGEGNCKNLKNCWYEYKEAELNSLVTCQITCKWWQPVYKFPDRAH
jgi:hypothetical protein